jgi:hypothetical protein
LLSIIHSLFLSVDGEQVGCDIAQQQTRACSVTANSSRVQLVPQKGDRGHPTLPDPVSVHLLPAVEVLATDSVLRVVEVGRAVADLVQVVGIDHAGKGTIYTNIVRL